PLAEGDGLDPGGGLRLRHIEYATAKGRAEALGDRLRAGDRAFHREGGTVELPPKGGNPDALAAAWLKVLTLTRRTEEEVEIPGERYSVEQRTAEIEALIAEQPAVTFATLLGDRPTLGY